MTDTFSEFPPASSTALGLAVLALRVYPPMTVLWCDPWGFRNTTRDVRVALDEGRVSPDFVLWEMLKARRVHPPLYAMVLDHFTGEVMEAAHRIAQTACGPACARCGHDTASHLGGYGSCRRCGPAVCGGYLMRGAS